MADLSGRDVDRLVERLREEAGENLRTVTTYREETYELLFMRENVDAIYSTEEIDVIFEEIRLEGWGRERLEDLFNAGSLECSVYGFEKAMMLHFVKNGFSGVFITYDRNAGIDTESFIRVCENQF